MDENLDKHSAKRPGEGLSPHVVEQKETSYDLCGLGAAKHERRQGAIMMRKRLGPASIHHSNRTSIERLQDGGRL